MSRFDLHVHTRFCDGNNTAEEMVLAALDKKLDCLGFTAHSYTFFDESYCLSRENTQAYREEIARLKEKYAGQIQILCGIEQDVYSQMPTNGYDYVIASMHYLKKDGAYLPLDESAALLCQAVNRHYGGDFFALVEDYYAALARLVPGTNADIIGHFDLITKFCELGLPVDQENPRYIAAYTAALDALLPLGIPFEINTGAIARGYRSTPYPSRAILEEIQRRGGRVLLSSDSHSAHTLAFQFERWAAFARELGFVDFSFSKMKL